jgi:hypothetical protein
MDELVAGHAEGHDRGLGIGELRLLHEQDVGRRAIEPPLDLLERAFSELTFQVAMRMAGFVGAGRYRPRIPRSSCSSPRISPPCSSNGQARGCRTPRGSCSGRRS